MTHHTCLTFHIFILGILTHSGWLLYVYILTNVHVMTRCCATVTSVANGLANCKPCWNTIPYFCAKWCAHTSLAAYTSLWMPRHIVMFIHGSWLVCGRIIRMFFCTSMVPGLRVRKSLGTQIILFDISRQAPECSVPALNGSLNAGFCKKIAACKERNYSSC